MDAKSIYTLLAPEVLTTAQQNLFVYAELIDEDSIDFYINLIDLVVVMPDLVIH